LEIKMRGQRGAAKDKTNDQIRDLLVPFMTERKPLTEDQIDIFNNCQIMVASDAANVGLNWPAKHLWMYDSLFSPMEEWQRITRAARMLPPAVTGPAKALVKKIGAYISKIEAQNDFKEYEGIDSAMLIVQEAIEKGLTPAEQAELSSLPGGAPSQVLEAWFAKRAFDKIAVLREEVGNEIRTTGDVPDPSRLESYIPPEAITEADVMNHIIRKKLSPFDVEILKSRRFLVDVKRLTVSVDMPEFVTVSVVDPFTGKKKKKKIPTGNMITESPAMAEKSQLAQGRAKMVPYEYFLKVVQNEQPKHTKYDYTPAWKGSLAAFSLLEDGEGNPVGAPPQIVEVQNDDGTKTYVTQGEYTGAGGTLPESGGEPPTTRKGMMALAKKMGAEAFAAGKKSVPPMALYEMISKQFGGEIGTSTPFITAYTEAWHRANAAAPVEKSMRFVVPRNIRLPGRY
jgi:hypothetical protein